MRSVRVLLIGAVLAAAVAVPALAAVGGSASSSRGAPPPALCQTGSVKQLDLSATQASALRSACDTFTAAVAAADRAYAARVDKLAPNDRVGLWQARQERRAAVWAARDEFHATVQGTLGVAQQNAGGRSLGRGHGATDVRERPGFGRMGGGAGRRGQGRGPGGQGHCPYAQS